MPTLLDHDPSPLIQKPAYFSYTSLAFGTILWILTPLAIFIFPDEITVAEMYALPPWLPVTIRLSFLAGLTCTIGSFIRKEPSSYPKWIGAGLILLPILVFLGFVVFYWIRAGI
jgi:hypothetical protein